METKGAPNYDYLVSKLNELPTLPTIVYELSKIINNPMSSTKEVERVMANDQSMTMKVLRLANSAYYAIPGGVTSLARAIAFLGFDTVNQLVLSSSIISSMKSKSGADFDIKKFWVHCLGVAVASEVIAKSLKFKNSSDLFTCGLVHDIGKVAIVKLEPTLMDQMAQLANTDGLTIHQVEKRNSYPQHPLLGQTLAKKWQLPSQIQMAIRYHHEHDLNRRIGASNDMNGLIDIVYLSNLLVQEIGFGNSGHVKVIKPEQVVLDRLNIKIEDLPKFLEAVNEKLAAAEAFVQMLGES